MTNSRFSQTRRFACSVLVSAGAFSGVFAQSELPQTQGLAAAQKLLVAGDAAYEGGDYSEAAEAFGKALSLASAAGGNKTAHSALKLRYAKAAVESARNRMKLGDYPEATRLLDSVLAESMLPTYADALTLRDQQADPIKTNPALTLEHSQNVQQVAFGLRKGNGAIDLGDYDKAISFFEGVLRIDPYNKAARRGMERAEAEKQRYYRSAYDQTRAKLFAEVDSQWELDQALNEYQPTLLNGGEAPALESQNVPLELLKTLSLNSVVLEDTTLSDAIDYLSARAIELDQRNVPANQKGINFVVDGGSEVLDRSLTLKLSTSLPMEAALDFITEKTKTKWVATPFAIQIIDKEADVDSLISRTWQVPPDFISRGSLSGEGGGVSSDDPFESAGVSSGPRLLTKSLTAREFFEQKGVSFPDGASVAYNPGSGTVMMVNSVPNIDITDQIISLIAQEEPISVIIKAQIIQVSEITLNELGFEALTSGGQVGTGGDLFFGGGTTPGEANPTTGLNPLTSGLRSGSGAIPVDGIDSLLANVDSGFENQQTPAPGILSASYFGRTQVNALLRGLQQKGGADIAATPSVVTRPGQRATFRQVREFIYPTEYEPPELPNSVGGGTTRFGVDEDGNAFGATSQGLTPVTPATPTAFEARDVGVILEAEATVSADRNYINLSVVPSITEFDGFVNYGSPIRGASSSFDNGFFDDLFDPTVAFADVFNTSSTSGIITPNEILQPVFSTVRANTTLTIVNGGSIAIGGLLSSQTSLVEDSVPLLGELPLIGRFFQSEAEQIERQAVVIIVSAEVVDPTGRRLGTTALAQ